MACLFLSHAILEPPVMSMRTWNSGELHFPRASIIISVGSGVQRYAFVDANSHSGPDNPPVITNNTYKGLRVHGSGYDLYYAVWCSGEHELYDLTVR